MEQTHVVKNTDRDLGLSGKLLLFAITVIAVLLMFAIFYYLEDWREENMPQPDEPEDIITSGMLACVELGCPVGTKYIGSSMGEVYHDCTSSQARSIKEDNRICFKSADDAIAQGYRN